MRKSLNDQMSILPLGTFYILLNLAHFICISFTRLLPSRLGLYNTAGYDTMLSDADVPVMLELWEIQSTPSLPSLPSPLRPGVISSDWVLFIGKIELNCVLMLN